MNIYSEATALVVKALIDEDKNITALNGGRFLTTRVSNHIVELRKEGLEIETQILKTESGKRYGRYELIQTDRNFKLAIELLEKIEHKLSA